MTLLSLHEEDSSIHTNGAPLDGLGDLSLSQLNLLAISAEIWWEADMVWHQIAKINELLMKKLTYKVQRIVKDALVLHGVIDLAFDLLVRVRLLVLIVDVVNPQFVVSTPKLCNT